MPIKKKDKSQDMLDYEALCDIWQEANAVDTVVGRPDVLMQKIAKLRDDFGSRKPTSRKDWEAGYERCRQDMLADAYHADNFAPASKEAGKAESYRVFKDGNAWCAVGPGFVDIQQSLCAFHDESPYRALELLTEAEAEEKRRAYRKNQPSKEASKAEPDYKPRKFVRYGDCQCILTQYCDGTCNPIYEDPKPSKEAGKAEGMTEQLREALLIARDHIDMEALRTSHCKDADKIMSALARNPDEERAVKEAIVRAWNINYYDVTADDIERWKEAGKVEAVADERYADDIACLRGAVSHWRKVLGVDNIEAARKRVHELARPVVLEAIFASLYLRPSQQALSDEEILALNVGERFFSESPTKYPEAGHGTQYHAGAPGVIGFARAILAAAGGSEK